MTDWTVNAMSRDPQVLSKRLGIFLRDRVSARELSDRINCDIRTAENLRRGHWPMARHWLGLVVAFGEDVTEAVFHPERAAERLEREIRDLEEQLAARKAAHEQVAGEALNTSPRRAKALAALQNRAAETVERPTAP